VVLKIRSRKKIRATKKSRAPKKIRSQEKLVRCCFTKDDSSYYGKNFFQESVSGNKIKIDTGMTKWPHKYPNGKVYYKIISNTKDIADKKIQRKAVAAGVTAIGLRVNNIKLRRQWDNKKPADIEIHFTHDDQMFIDRPNVLAYAYLVPKKPEDNPLSKRIVFNDRHFWTAYGGKVTADKVDPVHYKKGTKVKIKAEPLLHVFMHEFIHKLGFRHDIKNKDSIMWPTSKDPSHPNAFNLHKRDITRLENKYGKRPIRENIIKLHKKRRLSVK